MTANKEFICKKWINATLKKKEPQVRFVKKASIVLFQGITASRFTAETDKHPCCLWTEVDKSILALFRSGDKAELV